MVLAVEASHDCTHGFLMLPLLFLNQQLKLSDSERTAIKKETSCDIVPRPASQPLCGANSSIFWAFKNRPGWPPDSDPAPSTLEEKLVLGLKGGMVEVPGRVVCTLHIHYIFYIFFLRCMCICLSLCHSMSMCRLRTCLGKKQSFSN